jgi:hypothetical protein
MIRSLDWQYFYQLNGKKSYLLFSTNFSYPNYDKMRRKINIIKYLWSDEAFGVRNHRTGIVFDARHKARIVRIFLWMNLPKRYKLRCKNRPRSCCLSCRLRREKKGNWWRSLIFENIFFYYKSKHFRAFMYTYWVAASGWSKSKSKVTSCWRQRRFFLLYAVESFLLNFRFVTFEIEMMQLL